MATTDDTAQFHPFDASDYRVGIVVAQFNKTYTEAALEYALDELGDYEVPIKNIDIARVAGSIEIPAMLQAMAKTEKYDCLVAIGVIIKGESAHFDYVAGLVTDGILRVQLDNTLPVGFGILTAYNEDQVRTRTTIGREAVTAALHSAKEIKEISK
jgi:6,7-dimethyl-8-ribityllumazine synthase